VHDGAAAHAGQPGRSGGEPGVGRAAARGDEPVPRPEAPGVVGRGGVPGLSADHRGAVEPDPDSRPGRIQRPGATPEPGDTTGPGAVQAVRLPAAVLSVVRPTAERVV